MNTVRSASSIDSTTLHSMLLAQPAIKGAVVWAAGLVSMP